MVDDHKIRLRKLVLHETESLASMAFQSISLYSEPGMPLANGEPKSSVVALMKMCTDHKKPVFAALTILKDVLEISTIQQALVTSKDKRDFFHQSTLLDLK